MHAYVNLEKLNYELFYMKHSKHSENFKFKWPITNGNSLVTDIQMKNRTFLNLMHGYNIIYFFFKYQFEIINYFKKIGIMLNGY